MILRQNPSDKEKCSLIMVDSKTSIKLHKNGFFPRFISPNGSYIFYAKTEELVEFMQDNDLKAIE